MNSISSFNKLLEHYVFSVADQIIDLADAQTQARLIKLIHQIDLDAPPSDLVCDSATFAPPSDLTSPVAFDLNNVVMLRQQEINTPGKPPFIFKKLIHQSALHQLRQVHQHQLTTLVNLARQVAQVKANLVQTQAKLEKQIDLNKIMLTRCKALAKV